MEIDELKEKTTDLANHIEDLAQTLYKLALVNITQKTSRMATDVAISLCVWVLVCFALFFTGFAFAWWMGNVVNSRAGGFLLGALLFIVLSAIILAIKKKVIFPYIRNQVIRKFYDTED